MAFMCASYNQRGERSGRREWKRKCQVDFICWAGHLLLLFPSPSTNIRTAAGVWRTFVPFFRSMRSASKLFSVFPAFFPLVKSIYRVGLHHPLTKKTRERWLMSLSFSVLFGLVFWQNSSCLSLDKWRISFALALSSPFVIIKQFFVFT